MNKAKFYYFVRNGKNPECVTENEMLEMSKTEEDKKRLSGNVATVCVVDQGLVGRGVSPCSPDDTFDIEKGKFHAENRALRALKFRRQDDFINPKGISVLMKTACPFTEQGEVVNPTFYEQQLLYGRRNVLKEAELIMNKRPAQR